MNLIAINYHYIRNNTFKSGIYPTKPEKLFHQVKELSRKYDFISQNDLVEILQKPLDYKNKNFGIITFDDGLKEQIAILEDLLKLGVKPIFFINTFPLTSKTVLEVHKLHLIRTLFEDSELLKKINLKQKEMLESINEKTITSQYRYDSPESAKLKYLVNFLLSNQEKIDFINSLFCELDITEEEYHKELYMNQSEIKELSKLGLIGSHGNSHVPLGTLTKFDSDNDISKSIEILKDITGLNEIPSFSYPYGGVSAIPKDLSIFSELNVHFAFTMQRSINTTENLLNPHLLNRFDTNDITLPL
jgi:hypothetical protein